MIMSRNYASRKQTSYKIMKILMFQAKNKANPITNNKKLKLSGRPSYGRLTDFSTITATRN